MQSERETHPSCSSRDRRGGRCSPCCPARYAPARPRCAPFLPAGCQLRIRISTAYRLLPSNAGRNGEDLMSARFATLRAAAAVAPPSCRRKERDSPAHSHIPGRLPTPTRPWPTSAARAASSAPCAPRDPAWRHGPGSGGGAPSRGRCRSTRPRGGCRARGLWSWRARPRWRGSWARTCRRLRSVGAAATTADRVDSAAQCHTSQLLLMQDPVGSTTFALGAARSYGEV